jgi:23S rRNA maturation mini-RNase III
LTDAINAANDLLDTIQTAYVTDAVYENNYEEYVPEPVEEEATPTEEETTATEETNEQTANDAACSSFVVVTKDNASDIMCALGNYLNA